MQLLILLRQQKQWRTSVPTLGTKNCALNFRWSEVWCRESGGRLPFLKQFFEQFWVGNINSLTLRQIIKNNWGACTIRPAITKNERFKHVYSHTSHIFHRWKIFHQSLDVTGLQCPFTHNITTSKFFTQIQIHQVAIALDLCGLHGLAAAAYLAVLLKQRHLQRAMAWRSQKSELTNIALQTSTNQYGNMMPICLNKSSFLFVLANVRFSPVESPRCLIESRSRLIWYYFPLKPHVCW